MSFWDAEPEEWLRRFFYGRRGSSGGWFSSGGGMPDNSMK